MKHFHCPVNGWDCPYYKGETEVNGVTETCVCMLDDPYHDCDDFYSGLEVGAVPTIHRAMEMFHVITSFMRQL